jgi:hypothetical protein
MNILRTTDGRLNGMRIAAWFFLAGAGLDLYSEGWRSPEFIGALMMAIGFFAMSTTDEPHASERRRMRSPLYAAGVALSALGLALQLYDTFVQTRS